MYQTLNRNHTTTVPRSTINHTTTVPRLPIKLATDWQQKHNLLMTKFQVIKGKLQLSLSQFAVQVTTTTGTINDVRSHHQTRVRRSASEYNHLWTCLSFWPDLGLMKVSWWYLKRLKSTTLTHTPTNRPDWKPLTMSPLRACVLTILLSGQSTTTMSVLFIITAAQCTLVLHVPPNSTLIQLT